MSTRGAVVALTIALSAPAASSLSACGGPSAGTSNTPVPRHPIGTKPDLVGFAPSSHAFAMKVPRGWIRTTAADATVFTNELDRLSIEQIPYGSPSSEASFRSEELPTLRRLTPGFRLRSISTARLPAGPAILVQYTETATDPASGTPVIRDVQRYELWHADQRMVLTVASPPGRPGPWRAVLDSFQWRR